MRPPFIRCGTACEKTMGNLGYHVIIWDLDTDDYNNDSPTLIENSKKNIRDALAGHSPVDTDWLSIAYYTPLFSVLPKLVCTQLTDQRKNRHDIHEQTVVNLTEYQINYDLSKGYKRMSHFLIPPSLGSQH